MNNNSFQFSDGFNGESEATPHKVVALYARVSTVEQAEEGYSIDEQVRVLREMCQREGYEIYQEYVDRGISGKNIKGRPALIELLSDANEKKFDLVLVWKMNRFSRKSLDLLTIVDMLKNKNIGFRSYTERYETESPSGKLQFQMMAAIAEFERANIAENVKMGMLARAREGSWNGGHVLGYDVVSTGTDNRKRKISKLVVNEDEAQTVRKIFALYTEGHGYKSIAGKLNREGRKTKRKKSFSINGVKQILDNPLYMGVIRYNVRRDWNEKRRNNINPDPVMKKGTHEPLITQETWDKTRAIRKSRGGKPSRIHGGEFPLTGIIRCPVCDSGMVIGRTTNTHKDGTKKVIEYYVCGAWKNKGTTVCRSNGIRTDYADKYVLERIATVANNDILIKKIVDTINTKQTSNTGPLEKEYKSIKNAINSIQVKKDKMLGLYEEGILQKLELSNRLTHFNKEKEDLENRLASIEQQLGQGIANGISFEIVKAVMKEFLGAYKQSLTYEQRKRLLHLLIDKITISETREIDTIQIILNKEVVKHFTTQGRENSLTDEFSRPFSVCIHL